MTPLVVDCSAFLACVLPDEEPAAALFDALGAADFIVPAIWPVEVANALLVAERKGRVDAATLKAVRSVLAVRPVEVEPADVSRTLGDVHALARTHGLTVYDAAYLELARRRAVPLATLDEALRKVARRVRVKLV